MSIQLVLSHYLAGLRERNELDALLPELLKAMGHSVQSRAQIGVGQAGVDVVSVFPNAEGIDEVYLFVIKFGNLGREDFYVGTQSIDSSIREAANDFARNRLLASHTQLRKRIVLLTNGDIKQEAQAGWSALSKDIAERPLLSLEFWGIDTLTPLIERYIFDETLLLEKGKSDLRAALAGLEESGTAIRRFIRFVDSCFDAGDQPQPRSKSARMKGLLKRCTAALMGWGVLLVWGRSENNLKPGVVAGEYILLRMWTEAVSADVTADAKFLERLDTAISMHVNGLIEYFDSVSPQLKVFHAVASYRPDRLMYGELVFEELGRLASLLLLLQRFPYQEENRRDVALLLIQVLNEHPGCHLPAFDHQAIDVTLACLALMGESDSQNTSALLSDIISRFRHALRTNKFIPIDTDLIEDAIAVQVTSQAEPREFFQTSSLYPALATLSAALGDEVILGRLRELEPLMEGVTFERWYPAVELETLTGSQLSVQDVGVSRSVAGARGTTGEEMAASLKAVQGAAMPNDFKWHGTPYEVLIAISARLHRHPLPTWMIAAYAEREEEKCRY